MQKALIYCRVSSQRQVVEGHGLKSQQSRCREYAKSKGYQVVRVFEDKAVSGGLFERKAMQELINFLQTEKKQKHVNYVVVFDDLKRFARDVNVHLKLKAKLLSYDAKLECLNFNFEDTPEGHFIELIIAGQGQLEREQNKRQVVQKMKARMEAGYWCLSAPCGYEFIRDATHGKIIHPIEHQAKILKQGLEGFACGRFRTQKAFLAFLNRQCFRNKPLFKSQAKRLLTNPLYAGYYEYNNWGISWRKAKHKAIISLTTYKTIQQILNTKERILVKVDNADFPLRGLIACKYCGKSMTGSHVKGRSKYYALYSCNTKSCIAKPKNIQKQRLETDYSNLLRQFNADKKALRWFKEILFKKLKHRSSDLLNIKQTLESQKRHLNKRINILLDRLSETDRPNLIESYEVKLSELQFQAKKLNEKLHNIGDNQKSVRTAYNVIEPLLENPCKYWISKEINKKKVLHRSMFPYGLTYAQNQGFRTAESSFLFSLKRRFRDQKFNLVDYLEHNWNQLIENIMALKLLFYDD